MSDDGELKLQQLKNWIEVLDTECARGNLPDADTGAQLVTALKSILGWCEDHVSVDVRRAMAVAVDRQLVGG